MDPRPPRATPMAFEAIGAPGRDLSRLLAETLEAAVVAIDPAGIVTYASSYCEDLFGIRLPLLVRTHFTSLMSQTERRIALMLLEQMTAGTRFPIATWLLRRADGTSIWVESRVTIIRDADDTVTGYITVTRDMSERRLAQQTLMRTRANYDALVRRAVYGVYRAERNQRMLDVNPAMLELLGYDTREELLALDLARDVYADTSDHEWLVRTAQAGELDDWVEVTWRRRDGELIDVRLSLRMVEDEDGGPPVFEGIAEDVTERHRRDERLRRSERMASLGHMLAGVAHELNNPLAAISGFSQLLLRGSWPDDDRKALETIGREARRAERVVRDLLTFARQGNVTRSELVDLHGVIRHIVDTQRYALDTRGVRVILTLAEQPVYVQGDTARLEQVMLNLVVNARQALEAMRGERAMKQAPLELRISTETEDDDTFVLVKVSDNGAGISPSLLGRIWEPFFTTKEEGVGTGLGLSVVHSIVTEHGGVVDVQSELGRGTEFIVRLPLVGAPEVDEDVELAPAAAAPPAADSVPIGRALDILVVDDEAAIISFLTRFLTSRGHAVVGASDGLHALRIAEQFTFDVVVCDLHMPEMDGVELIRRMRMLPSCSGTRYVLSSGDGPGSPMMGRAEALNVDGLLAKPYTIDQLVAVVEGTPAL
ncbi:MAG: PAS domain S-box protein [Gemmatimonadaceae bacterium]|nr:PAS domain S-box protein [Gemmatimonadaceae bacterium]